MIGKHYDVVVVGGGAAGIVAAISAKRLGAAVLLCEKLPKLGKKVLASGAGRCNLSNDKIGPSCYNPEAKDLTEAVFSGFGGKDILSFFNDLGLCVYSDEGKIYPVTNQAASVMDVLELELSRLGAEVACQCEVTGVTEVDNGFRLAMRPDKHVNAKSVVVCGGGKSYPAFGSDGGTYAFASRFGHKMIEPVPVAVPLVVKDNWCHFLQGQRIRAVVESRIDGKAGKKDCGELLFTKYGLSGTAILDISDEISIALNRLRKKNVEVVVDLVPFMSEEALREELLRRFGKKIQPEKILIGILPHKFSPVLADILKTRDVPAIVARLKARKFSVSGTRGWNEAEFTAGGVDTHEVFPKTLESKLCRGLYFAGEILNIHGRRGGYNLAWAWSSGYIAGRASVSSI